jgi:hypothetical protein
MGIATYFLTVRAVAGVFFVMPRAARIVVFDMRHHVTQRGDRR